MGQNVAHSLISGDYKAPEGHKMASAKAAMAPTWAPKLQDFTLCSGSRRKT